MAEHKPKPITEEQAKWIESAWDISADEGIVRSKLTGREIGWVGEGNYTNLRLVEGWRLVRRAHVIWWKHTGKWPERMLDHEDRNRLNDKVGNLRYTTPTLNALNSSYDRGKRAYI